MKTNLIMPMGGAGTRFLNNGFECPKPLIELCGKPFFARACDSVRGRIPLRSLTFVVLREHIEDFGIDRRIHEVYPEARIVSLPEVLNGAVLTAMEGAKTIANDDPVIFLDCDLSFECEVMDEFYKAEAFRADGTLLTFRSDLDRYSYVRIDEEGYALETAEKRVISGNAVTGAYGFRSAGLFLEAAERYLTACEYREYYMSGIYNLLIADRKRIRVFEADRSLSFGTPEEYAAAARLIESA